MTDLPELPDGFEIPDHIGSITDRDEDMLPSQANQVQVIAAIAPAAGSPYVATVQPTDDVAIPLTRDRALAYAAVVWQAATQSVYFAGVRAQMRDVMSGRGRHPVGADVAETVEWMVGSFIQEVLPPDHEATAPMRFEPCTKQSTGEPYVKVTCNGEVIDYWSPDSARHHANAVIVVSIAADLDTAYRTYAVANIGVEELRGRAMVDDVGKYLQHFHDPDPLDGARPPRAKVPGPPPGARPAAGKRGRKRSR